MSLPVIATFRESLRGLRAHAPFLAELAAPSFVVSVLYQGLTALERETGGETAFLFRVLLISLTLWLTAALTVNVCRLVLKGRAAVGPPLAAAVRLSRAEVTLVVTSLLVGLACAAGALIGFLPLFLIVFLIGKPPQAIGLVFVVLSMIGVAWVALRLSLVGPAIAEGRGLGALRASWRLTRGAALRVAGLMALTGGATALASLALGLAAALVFAAVGIVAALLLDGPGTIVGLVIGGGVILSVGVAQTAGLVLSLATLSLAYFWLRQGARTAPPEGTDQTERGTDQTALGTDQPTEAAPPPPPRPIGGAGGIPRHARDKDPPPEA